MMDKNGVRKIEIISILIALVSAIIALLSWLSPFTPIDRSPLLPLPKNPSVSQPTAPVFLTSPTLLSPENGAVFNNFPRTTTLRWSPVPGAIKYVVQIEIDVNPGADSPIWVLRVEGGEVFETSYTFEFPAANKGRWRVYAIDNQYNEGAKSDWWYFTFTK